MSRQVAQGIRQLSKTHEHEPCWVCGDYQEMTHLHHVLPVADMCRIVPDLSPDNSILPITRVWLCPNHHAMVHAIWDGEEWPFRYLTEEQVGRCTRLFNLTMADVRAWTAVQ